MRLYQPYLQPLKTAGFTLIELIIVIILSSIISVVTMKMLATGFEAYATGRNITNAEQQVENAFERMTRDLQGVRSPNDIITASSSQFTFTNLSGTSITYALNGTSLMRNSQILADGITGLTFNYYNESGASTTTLTAIRFVGISLNVIQANANFSAGTAVFLEALS